MLQEDPQQLLRYILLHTLWEDPVNLTLEHLPHLQGATY
jgi:hypothetical protein